MAYDGLEVLIKVLEKDGGLVKHLVENTLFFQPDCVKQQAAEMQELANFRCGSLRQSPYI